MHTLRRPKVHEQASEQIKRFIIDQKLAPGDRLPTENQLAETFGISRLSLREATKALWQLGIARHSRLVELLVAQDVAGATTELRHHIASHWERI